MTERTKPPFRADHVGSLLRPKKLREARDAFQKNALSRAELTKVEDESIREAVKLQEDVGLRLATDGEFRRKEWHMDFLTSFANVTRVPSSIKMRFHTHEGDTEVSPEALKIVGKLGRPRGIFVDHFKFLKSVARGTPKQTIPSPTIMHFRGGRGAVDKTAYPDMAQFFADLARVYNEEVQDLAAAGCRYLQIDETNFAYLCDPTLRDQVKANIGEDPNQLTHTYAKLISESVAGRPADMAVCMHLCRGNNQSAWVAEGGYDPVAEVLFNEVKIDGFFLEYDSPRAGDFKPLRFVPKGKLVVLGLVTTKLPQLEKKDELKRRIEEAAKYVPIEQLCLSPQCGFSSTVEGNKVTVEDEIAKLRLVVDVAREVWGSA
ncbi:MAG TPA: 5-methyltetrahydropteroyltriglutamate--homocysteine S-methyltransferase [Alphaproteobacteria bacterium]|nr:5-methyltetrahydropteroyltriglutamate--homocysteine S-methyltransferase [Alphaproteobacteria bacterium]